MTGALQATHTKARAPTPSLFRSQNYLRLATRAPEWEMPAVGRRNDQNENGGVHLPFMAPTLWGVRVRGGRRGLEFILPNPSGGRGVYVAAWTVVTGFAAPSPHDTLLVGRLSGRDVIGPADVRQVARSVSMDGYAGVDAAQAAQAAQSGLEIAALRLRAQFLLTLARRAGFNHPDDAARCLDPIGFNVLAARLGWRGPKLAEALEGVSVRYASIAVGSGSQPQAGASVWRGRPETGRWGRLLSLVQRLRNALADEQCASGGPDGILLGRVMNAADRCIGQVERLLPEIEPLLADPLPLLEAWRDRPGDPPAWWLQALETAFDGWDRICLLWFDSPNARLRRALIPEMAARAWATAHGTGWTPASPDVAPLPMEADGNPACDEQRLLVTRNERIRAQELTLDLMPT